MCLLAHALPQAARLLGHSVHQGLLLHLLAQLDLALGLLGLLAAIPAGTALTGTNDLCLAGQHGDDLIAGLDVNLELHWLLQNI